MLGSMVTSFLLSIVVKKECIVNAFIKMSTPIRHAREVLPLVKKYPNRVHFVEFLDKNKKKRRGGVSFWVR